MDRVYRGRQVITHSSHFLALTSHSITGGGGMISPGSALTILADSFASHQTYQLIVQMENRQSAADQATGYLLVRIEDNQPQLIVIG